MKKSTLVLILIILFSFALSFYFYPKLPRQIATHWNLSGQADGYSSKEFGLFLFPGLLIFLFGLFMTLPHIDPLTENVKKFWREFITFITILFFFMIYMQLLLIQWNRGVKFDFIRFLVPALSALFYYVGILLTKAKRNWFIGIRTPWTLSNDKVWDKTSELGAKLFKISAILSLGGLIFPDFAMWFILCPILGSTIFVFVYSYLIYQKI